ncbi:hypothetical protein ACI6Q2_18830 [Chitinophagaceae bacterium LWZ2-11]
MIRQFFCGILFISLLNISENSQAQKTAANNNKYVNSVAAEVSGDESKSIKVSGEEGVALGLLKFTKTNISPLTVGGTVVEKDGTSYKVFFVMPVLLQTGVEQTGDFGSFVTETDVKTKTYSTTMYKTYFDTDKNGANSKVYLTLTQILDVGNYVMITGNFHFNAAYDENPDSIEGASPGEQLPPFNGNVRGSKKVSVKSSFTIYLNKILRD